MRRKWQWHFPCELFLHSTVSIFLVCKKGVLRSASAPKNPLSENSGWTHFRRCNKVFTYLALLTPYFRVHQHLVCTSAIYTSERYVLVMLGETPYQYRGHMQ